MRSGRFWIAIFLCASASGAQIKMKILEDGSRMLYNDPPRRPAAVNAYTAPRPSMEIDELIEIHSERARLDPQLVRAVIQVESGFSPVALSAKGAMGLMQLMPDTADRYAVVDPYDPDENIGAGTVYLRWLLDEFGDELELALAGYNAGPTAVKQFGGIPPYPETMDYVERVLRIYMEEPDYSLDGSPQVRLGRKTFLVRDASGQLVMTTTPPATD
jgi:soluble lytic murein transglycosylase-like protein